MAMNFDKDSIEKKYDKPSPMNTTYAKSFS